MDTAITSFVETIEVKEDLIGEDGCQDLQSVVVDAEVPSSVAEKESTFQPDIEWLNRCEATSIETLAAGQAKELVSLTAMALTEFAGA